jgi:DNA-binding transcriptional regulator YhcF (GntR family)
MNNKLNSIVSTNWKLDKNSSTTVIKQIIGYIKERIVKGYWLVGK